MSFYATDKHTGQSTMRVQLEDSVKVSQRHVSREERVFVSPDPPFSNIQHLLPGETLMPQPDGKLEKIGIQLEDAEQLQSKDFLNTPDAYMYSIKKSGNSYIGTAKTQGSKKAMAPRSSQDFLSLQDTGLMEKPGKPEKQDETQEGQSSTDEFIKLALQLLEEYDSKSNFSSNLDWRMPLPSSSQSHFTFNQNQDLAPKVHPPEIQTTKDFETVDGNESFYQGNPPYGKRCNLESFYCKDQGIKDNSYQEKTLPDFIEIESDTDQENSEDQVVCDSGTVAINEMTCGDLLTDSELMKNLMGCDTGTANAKKETNGKLAKDTKIMKNQMSNGIGTVASGPVTCDNLPGNTELLNLMRCDAGTADSMEAAQQELLKDTKLIKNQVACSTGTVSGAMTYGNLPTDTDLLNLMGFDTRTAASQAVVSGGLPTDIDLLNLMVSDNGTATAKKETNEDLPTDIGLVENHVDHFTRRAASKAVACGDLLTGMKPRKDQIGYDTGTVNANGISHGTEDLNEFSQNHTKIPLGLHSVCAEKKSKTSTKIEMTEGMMSGKEIMAENEQYRRRLVKKRMKRMLENRTNEPASKVRRTASWDFQDNNLGGILEENWGVLNKGDQNTHLETSQQGLMETRVLPEKQFPMISISKYQYPICQGKDDYPVQESSFGNMPDLEFLGVKDI